jgi:hypothetical protein
MSDAHFDEVDLVVDLNSEDESGLPWSFLERPETRAPSPRELGSLSARGA